MYRNYAVLKQGVRYYGLAVALLIAVGELINRVWVAQVFWTSGLVKLQSWEATLYLFEYEYSVPLLSPTAAAWLGTAVELTFPLLLTLGLAGRFSAGILLVFNLTAVLSYPGLNAVGVLSHQVYSAMLLLVLVRGPGLLSFDALIARLARADGNAQPATPLVEAPSTLRSR